MTFSLEAANLGLDVLLKLLLLLALVYLVLILRNLDRTIKSVERSAESIENTSERIGRALKVSRYLPFVGGKKDE